MEEHEDSGPHVRRIVDRVGDEHQIFPEDGHRVAVAERAVNAYSVKFSVLEMHLEAAAAPPRLLGFGVQRVRLLIAR